MKLTPKRSIAVDSKYIPYGLPVYMETELPALPSQQPELFNRLMIAQDTGGAIRGAVRGDYFWGAGDAAAEPTPARRAAMPTPASWPRTGCQAPLTMSA